jgi:hypothetical protein
VVGNELKAEFTAVTFDVTIENGNNRAGLGGTPSPAGGAGGIAESGTSLARYAL